MADITKRELDVIEECILALKRLQRESRKTIRELRAKQELEKSMEVEKNGISRQACGGFCGRQSGGGDQ